MNTEKCEQALRQEILATTEQIKSLVATKETHQLEKVVVPHLAHLASQLSHIEYIKQFVINQTKGDIT